MRMTCTYEIACTPERLWKFIEEPERQKLWMKGLQDNQMTSEGPPAVGSTFRMKIKEGGKVGEYDGKITRRDPPQRLAVDLTGENFPCGAVMHVDYVLTDLSGRTRLDYTAQMESSRPLPLWMRLLMPLFKLFTKMQLRGFMNTLKRLAEAPDGAEAHLTAGGSETPR
jgi:carbon monoxide dehydrogenase subunit G